MVIKAVDATISASGNQLIWAAPTPKISPPIQGKTPTRHSPTATSTATNAAYVETKSRRYSSSRPLAK